MSRFCSERTASLDPYVPGEQPREGQFVKLNTNESPFPPAPAVLQAVAEEAEKANLYCDPACTGLRRAAAEVYDLAPENILPTNGSDEALYFAFLAFGGTGRPFAFADITYGFYPVFARITGTPVHLVPLQEDFSLQKEDYCALGENIVLANPNAPTGLALGRGDMEEILRTNPDHVVLVDEAYAAFGAESCVPLIRKYENLLVVQTFSKSHSLAGARLGFALGSAELIADLNRIKDSINPYNVNRMTQAAGAAALASGTQIRDNCRAVEEIRSYTGTALEEMGFVVLPSLANFLFARHPMMAGGKLYRHLRDRGILVRHFDQARIADYLRITIGSQEQMKTFLSACRAILRTE